MKLEGIDPEHQSLFCVMTVAEVQGCWKKIQFGDPFDSKFTDFNWLWTFVLRAGYRIRLHFDGYSDSYDHWVNADSENIFPCGWCEKNGQKLLPPKNHDSTKPFNWTQYLKQTGVVAAPRHLCASTQNEVSDPPPPNRIYIWIFKLILFIIINSYPASLGRSIRLRARFASRWNSKQSTGVTRRTRFAWPPSPTSSDLVFSSTLTAGTTFTTTGPIRRALTSTRSAGARSTVSRLRHPVVSWLISSSCSYPAIFSTFCWLPLDVFLADYDASSGEFTWERYLLATASTGVPPRSFKPRSPVGYRTGMKLECVDPRNPQLIRVATVAAVKVTRQYF